MLKRTRASHIIGVTVSHEIWDAGVHWDGERTHINSSKDFLEMHRRSKTVTTELFLADHEVVSKMVQHCWFDVGNAGRLDSWSG